jgi:hypothetical protein
MEKDAKDPKLAPKEVKVKQLQSQIDASQYKPDASKIAGKMVERGVFKKNGQWSLEKWDMEKRCWEGYEPTPGKKAYEKGSCQPVKKDDRPHDPESPEDSAHDVIEEGASLKEEIESLSPEDRDDMLRHLRSLKDKSKHRSAQNAEAGKDVEKQEVAPKGSVNRETYLKAFGKSEVEISFYDNGDAEIVFGSDITTEQEQELCNTILKKGYEEVSKKEWSPKAEHKSDKGGLTEAGRKSYNRATGGNLKAPQPGGGPRKRSFCARNAGQIKMHNIDCRKDPEKRACKARRRWKC